MKDFYTKLPILGVLILSLGNCSPEEEVAPDTVSEAAVETSLELNILDELGNPVEGALVKLYNSEENYIQESENEIVFSGRSDKNGKVLLQSLEPQAYYFSVTHGASSILTNWEGVVTTEEPLKENKINTLNVVIKESVLGYIVGYQKSWVIDKIYLGQEDYTSQMPACVTDDVMTFKKDMQFTISEGPTKCESTDPQEENGPYSINGSSITTVQEDGEEVVINVLSMSKDQFEMNGPELHPDARFVYKAVYNL